MVILENINIDIDKAILQNIDIDKISNRFKFGISNRAIWNCRPMKISAVTSSRRRSVGVRSLATVISQVICQTCPGNAFPQGGLWTPRRSRARRRGYICAAYPARALRALGLLLADGALTVGRGKTF